jgi:DnaJ-class molecular chaperone
MPLSKKPGERGDLIIRFSIVFPKYLPDAKKAALRSLLKSEIDMSPDLPKVPVTGDAAPEVENSPVEEDVN